MNILTRFALIGTLALLALTGCIVGPGGGGGYDHRGWDGHYHSEFHDSDR
jgi:hypothetical protein